jgi:hypothetical protein
VRTFHYVAQLISARRAKRHEIERLVMTNKKLRLIMLCALASLGCLRASHAQTPQCALGQTKVFFANGVWVDPLSAVISSIDLEIAYYNADPDPDNRIEFDLAYNPSAGLAADIMEAATQLAELNLTAAWRVITGLDVMPDRLRQHIEQIAAASTLRVSAPVVAAHVAKYQSALTSEKGVVIVAHSQGNLFANLAYQALTPEQQAHTLVVSVASPASSVPGGAAHVTLFEDLIARAFPSNHLPANTSNLPLVSLTTAGHGFSEAYIAPGSRSAGLIIGRAVDATVQAAFRNCWQARVFNVDASMQIIWNGTLVGSAPFCGNSGYVNLPSSRRDNTLEIILNNDAGLSRLGTTAATWGYEIVKDGVVKAQDRCGTACVAGCNNEQAFPVGEVFRRRWRISGGTITSLP